MTANYWGAMRLMTKTWSGFGGGQDQPHRRERHFPAQPRRLRSGKRVGSAVFAHSKSDQRCYEESVVTYRYSQLSHYLSCPRRYRHRYLDGWQEKDTRAAMLFGRAFERALAVFFLRQDAAAALFQEWKLYQDQTLEYSHGDTWDRMLEQGIQLLDRFCQEDRVRIRQPRRNLQIK